MQHPAGATLASLTAVLLIAAVSAAAASPAGGHVTLRCRIKPDGFLTACRVVKETPPGQGYGPAALKLAPTLKVEPLKARRDAIAGASVLIPIRFKTPVGGAPAVGGAAAPAR